MNIVLTLDNDYVSHAAAVIASVCSHNDVENIFIVSDYISAENKANLKKLSAQFRINTQLITIDKCNFKFFPIGKGTANNYVSLAAYFRLFIPEALPQSIDKVIYLDCDLIVNGSLIDLWNWNLNPSICIVALEEMQSIALKSIYRLKYDFSDSYFNSGVLLLNLKQLRAAKFTTKAIQYIKENHDIIKFHDQDVLNALLHKKKEYLPLKYNVMDTFLFQNAKLPHRYINDIDDLYNPIIVHFAGPIKPWFRECSHPYKDLYYHYLTMTPWEDYKPCYKYITCKQKIIYHTKRICKEILSFTGIKQYGWRKDLPNCKLLIH